MDRYVRGISRGRLCSHPRHNPSPVGRYYSRTEAIQRIFRHRIYLHGGSVACVQCKKINSLVQIACTAMYSCVCIRELVWMNLLYFP